MKKLLLVSVILTLFNCSQTPSSNSYEGIDEDLTIRIIDSCEYIEYDYGIFEQRVYSLTHKGNCKYCLNRKK